MSPLSVPVAGSSKVLSPPWLLPRPDAMPYGKRLAEMQSAPTLSAFKDKGLEEHLRHRAAQWAAVLTGGPTLARQGLRTLLAGPIVFAPDREGFRLRGSTRIGALWPDPIIMKLASPRGTESLIYQLRRPISGAALPA